MKLQDLLKDIELGKVYTDKDKPPFTVNEEKFDEGLGSALLPTWKIFIKGYKKPFRVAALDKRDAKRVAHEMMRNNTVKITRIVKEEKLTEAKDTIFDVATKVMKDKQHQNYKSKKGMVKVDMQTANLLTQVFKKVNPKMKKILSKMGEENPARLVQTLQAVVK